MFLQSCGWSLGNAVPTPPPLSDTPPQGTGGGGEELQLSQAWSVAIFFFLLEITVLLQCVTLAGGGRTPLCEDKVWSVVPPNKPVESENLE